MKGSRLTPLLLTRIYIRILLLLIIHLLSILTILLLHPKPVELGEIRRLRIKLLVHINILPLFIGSLLVGDEFKISGVIGLEVELQLGLGPVEELEGGDFYLGKDVFP